MIEEPARVIACDGDVAQVEGRRIFTCGSCSAQAGCGTSLLGRIWGGRTVRMRARNPIQAQPGERVVVGVQERGLVRASLVLYALPLLGLILFAILGQWAGRLLLPMAGEFPSILAGLLGLVTGLLLARKRSLRLQTGEVCRPVILRRVEEPDILLRRP